METSSQRGTQHFACCCCCSVAQLCLTLCNPKDCSTPPVSYSKPPVTSNPSGFTRHTTVCKCSMPMSLLTFLLAVSSSQKLLSHLCTSLDHTSLLFRSHFNHHSHPETFVKPQTSLSSTVSSHRLLGFPHHTCDVTFGYMTASPLGHKKMSVESESASDSVVSDFVTPSTVALQAPLSMGFPR